MDSKIEGDEDAPSDTGGDAANENDEEMADDDEEEDEDDDGDDDEDEIDKQDGDEDDDDDSQNEDEEEEAEENDGDDDEDEGEQDEEDGDDEEDQEEDDEEEDSSDEDDEDEEGDESSTKKVLTEDGREMSEYEMLRFERIRRNKEKLAALGLESQTGGGVLGEKKKPKKKKKERPSVEVAGPKRSSLSRRSKVKITLCDRATFCATITQRGDGSQKRKIWRGRETEKIQGSDGADGSCIARRIPTYSLGKEEYTSSGGKRQSRSCKGNQILEESNRGCQT